MFTLFLILFGIVLRLLPHIPNATPVAAMGLFAGAHIRGWKALLIPLSIMAISDYLLLYSSPFSATGPFRIYPIGALFHSTTIYVWTSMLVSVFIGIILRKKKHPVRLIGATTIMSFQFFLVTNFGVWAATDIYPHTLTGLMQSYIMGLGFFRFTILGDFLYSVGFFGLNALATSFHSRLSVVVNLGKRDRDKYC